MKLSRLGEFGLIERIAKRIKVSPRVVVGVGDDASVVKVSKSKLLIVTTDTLIEGVHFDLKYFNFFDLGFKALAVNISDISAMGGYPKVALVTIGLPKDFKVESVDELYRGLRKLARVYGIDIVGGDTVFSPKGLIISIALLGEVERQCLIRRDGARIGDVLLVTGDFGGSAAGLEILKRQKIKGITAQWRDPAKGGKRQKYKELIKKHLTPEPRVLEARVIAKSGLASSMIDDSDGLARCVIEICKMSGVGARIWINSIPIFREIDSFGERGKFLALYGGEDYELVFTASRRDAVRLSELIQKKTGTPVAIIGEVVPKRYGIKLIDLKGRTQPLKGRGYEHFKS